MKARTTSTGVATLRNLLGSPTQQATAWVRTYSTSAPDVMEDRIETGHGFGQLAVDGETIWVTNALSRSVARINGRNRRIDSRAELRRIPTAIAIGNEAAWVVCSNGWLWRFRVSGDGEGVARLKDRARGLTCDRESAWVLHADGSLVSVDQATGEISSEVKIRRGGRQLLSDGGTLLALSGNGSRLCRIATSGGKVEAEAKLPARGVRAALHGGTLWVACGRRLGAKWGALVPIDAVTMSVGSFIELPGAPRAIAAGAEHLWVACGRRGHKESSICKIEPGSGRIEPWAETEWTIYDLAIAGDQLLATTGLALAGPAMGMAHVVAGGGGAPAHHGGHHGGGGH